MNTPQRKDKAKILGEHFDDDRIRSFLKGIPRGTLSLDYCILEKAYRGMSAENFATFVEFFIAAGHDINAVNEHGQTLAVQIQQHRHGADYLASVIAVGASTY